MRWVAGLAFVVHMALIHAVISNMFYYRHGYSLHFPDRRETARIDRFTLENVPCVCPRTWAERERYRAAWTCLESTCAEERRQRQLGKA